MARKQRLQSKWKQIGCSIVSVGILSCGAGYRTRHPGYLPFTGPAEVRIEQPRHRSNVYVLEPLTIVETDVLKEAGNEDSVNVKTNLVPLLRETHVSTSSRPLLQPPNLFQSVPDQVTEPKSIEQLGREFLPNGFGDDLFNESLLNDKTSLRVFLDFFQTNQVQGNTRKPGPDIPLPPTSDTSSPDDAPSETKISNTP